MPRATVAERSQSRELFTRAAITVGIVVVVIGLALVKSGSVITGQAVVTGLLMGGVYGLVAMGLTLIFGVLDIVNFAHGSFMAVALVLTFWLVTTLGVHPYLGLLIVVPIMFVVGYLVQRGILNSSIGAPLENQLLITLGLSLILENGLLFFFGANPQSVALPGDRGIRILGAVADLSRVGAFVAALVLAGLLFLVLRRTRMGTAIRAVAANRVGAQLVGIDTRLIYGITFALGTACAGAAGVLLAPIVTIEPSTGALFNIVAFVVVVLGGMGNVLGALVGGLLIGLAEQVGGVLLTGQSPFLAVFIVFVLVLFLRPQGLLGRST